MRDNSQPRHCSCQSSNHSLQQVDLDSRWISLSHQLNATGFQTWLRCVCCSDFRITSNCSCLMPYQPRSFAIEKWCDKRLSFSYFYFYALYVCIFMLAILLLVVDTKSRHMAQVWPKCFYATSVAMAAKAVQNMAAVNCAPGQLLLGSQYLLGTLALMEKRPKKPYAS